jgi:epoxyqueuosine reductase
MSQQETPQELAAWLDGFIKDYAAQSPENSLKNQAGEKAWDEPLVGFSAGDDPLYAQCKEHIGDFFWKPEEIFNLTFPEQPAQAGELSVVSWVLPQAPYTKKENAAQDYWPSERWTRARLYGELFNRQLRKDVAQVLCQRGYPAVSPMLSPAWSFKVSEKYSFASTWSERHAAHIGGLGTFGLCDGLITPKGKAVRLGSVVVKARITPTPRPYADHHAYCLFFTHGTCGKCIPRCPVKALSEKGHDKVVCREHVMIKAEEYNIATYGLKIEGCGLCQVKVPCASRIPLPAEG